MTSSTAVTYQYLVAFQNGPFAAPSTITTVASPAGTLGGSNVWTDISQWVDSHGIMRGRQHELRQFEAGTCQLHLNNVDGRFNPWNSSSPYTGFLLPRKLLQVRVTVAGTTYTRFTGHIDSWPIEWNDPISGFASLHATDAFRLFQANNVTSTGYATQVLADGATGYWRLGDPAGATQAADSSGNNNPAAVPSDATYGSVTFGQPGAFVADPTTSASVPYSNNFANGVNYQPAVVAQSFGQLSSASGATFECWVNPGTSGARFNGQLALKFSGTNYGVYFNHQVTGTQIKIGDDGPGGAFSVVTIPNLLDGNWHHLVFTVNTSFSFNVYVDGVQYASGVTVTLTATTTAPWSWISTFGATSMSVQDWAVYPSVLTGAQVANHYNLATLGQQTTDARIGRILDIVGWSAAARNLDAGASTVQPVTSPLTAISSLSHLQDVEGTESGALFMTVDGKVRFLSRQTLLGNAVYTTSQATIGDTGSDLPMQPGPTLGIDDIDLYNEAVATRQNGLTQQSTNAASITSYGRVTWQPAASLLGISDAEVLALCQFITYKYPTPVVRIQDVTVDLFNTLAPANTNVLLGLDLMQAITVERQGVPGGGTAFSQLCNIEGIEESSAPDQYLITFRTAIANPAFWILGTSQLGIGTAVAF